MLHVASDDMRWFTSCFYVNKAVDVVSNPDWANPKVDKKGGSSVSWRKYGLADAWDVAKSIAGWQDPEVSLNLCVPAVRCPGAYLILLVYIYNSGRCQELALCVPEAWHVL
jgi:hypothetical protein